MFTFENCPQTIHKSICLIPIFLFYSLGFIFIFAAFFIYLFPHIHVLNSHTHACTHTVTYILLFLHSSLEFVLLVVHCDYTASLA